MSGHHSNCRRRSRHGGSAASLSSGNPPKYPAEQLLDKHVLEAAGQTIRRELAQRVVSSRCSQAAALDQVLLIVLGESGSEEERFRFLAFAAPLVRRLVLERAPKDCVFSTTTSPLRTFASCSTGAMLSTKWARAYWIFTTSRASAPNRPHAPFNYTRPPSFVVFVSPRLGCASSWAGWSRSALGRVLLIRRVGRDRGRNSGQLATRSVPGRGPSSWRPILRL